MTVIQHTPENDTMLYAGMGLGILNMMTAMQQMGHSTVKGHLIYSHVSDETPLSLKVLLDFTRFASMADGWEESRDRLFAWENAINGHDYELGD